MTTFHGDPMTSFESPTHPDAPRAGGETPPIDLEATRQRLDEIERRNIDPHAARVHYLTQADLRWLLESIRAALPSLLERHRDGERAEPDAWLVVIHVRRGGSNTTARYFYSERETAEREADRKCNAIGDSFAQIFPLFAASPDAVASAGPSPERAP